MSVVSMRELLEAGVHFGHQTRRWNPKMRRFIFTERGGIYIIDLQQTLQLLQEAHDFARNIAERGGAILFVGTKKQSQGAVETQAKRVGMPYVNHRWLGGLLTNWRTISDRIDRLHELRRLKDEGQLDLLPAKERISMLSELEKLEENLGGVADMKRQPEAVFIVDLRKEQLAVREARRLGLPVVRARRHELRSGRGRLRHSGQRRRDPFLRSDRARDRRRHRSRAAEGDPCGLHAAAAASNGAATEEASRRPRRDHEQACPRRKSPLPSRRPRLREEPAAEEVPDRWLTSAQHSSRSSATRPARR